MKIEETKKLELVQPRERDEEFFQVVDKLISEGINAGDVKKLQDAGISTYSGLMMHTMKNLAGIKGLSEAKVEKICEAAEEILNLGYITGSDALTKRKSVVESTTESQALDELLRASDSRGPNREKKDMVSSKMATSSQISGPKPPLAYAAGMKQNDDMLASKYWKLMPLGKVHGTLDCFIILEDGILMGADGRATNSYERIGQENLYIFHSDDNPKFLDLLPGIGITFEGDADRCKKLSQYLEKTVKEQRHHDLDSLTRVIVDYLHTHKLQNDSYGISLFLGGFSNEHQDYVVYYLKDREKPAVHKLPNSPYNALGCNTRVAIDCFTRDKVHPKMNLNAAVNCMTRALMLSAIADVCIGGELQVYWLTKNSTTRKVYRHCIDQMLDFSYNFDSSSEMFFFSCHPYHLLNYESLTLCLNRLGIVVGEIPNCLGIVSPGWSMFGVNVHPFHASRLMGNARELRYAAYPSHIRQIAFDMGGVRMIPVLIARASLELLRAVRENSLSSYFGYMGIRWQ